VCDCLRLFDKRGSIYSSRPDNFIGTQLLGQNDLHILLIGYGNSWRKQRKTIQAILNVNVVEKLLPIQNAEGNQTMFQIMTNPEEYYSHIRRYSTGVILASVFGQRAADYNSPHVRKLYHAQDQFTAILEQGATPPVDSLPFLKYIPKTFAAWKRWAKIIRNEQTALYMELLNETRDCINKDKAQISFMEQLLWDQNASGFDDEHLAYIGGVLLEAGSDTTTSTLLSFIMAMITQINKHKLMSTGNAECHVPLTPMT
jgi:cytochrome P450